MSWRGFAVAFALPLLFVASTLGAVAMNRAAVRGEVVLTDRDVTLDAGSDPNSGARVWVSWSEPATGQAWLPCSRLETLGFDCRVDPQSPAAERYYARQLPRYAFVAFALDGSRPTRSRLVPVDADRDAAALRRRYPDGRYVIAPATIGVARMVPLTDAPYISGTIVSIDPRSIQVPTELRGAIPAARAGTTPPMAITVRWGRRWEPWIATIRAGASPE